MSNNSCGCGNGYASPINSPSWYDVFRATPENPLDILANAKIGGAPGTFANSANYAAPGTWVASGATVAGEVSVVSLSSDDLGSVAIADQWNFSHQTADTLTTLAPPLRKVIYLKAGTNVQNSIPISLGGGTYDSFQLSYRDNAGTRGDATGTFPAITWAGPLGASVNLEVVLKHPGVAVMGLVMRNTATNDWSMFEMEWVIVS